MMSEEERGSISNNNQPSMSVHYTVVDTRIRGDIYCVKCMEGGDVWNGIDVSLYLYSTNTNKWGNTSYTFQYYL